MNRPTARYGRKNRHTGYTKQNRMSFEKKVALQTGTATAVFLICFAISRADGPYITPVKNYIAKTLTQSTNVTEAGVYLSSAYQKLREKFPDMGLPNLPESVQSPPEETETALPVGNVEETQEPLVQSPSIPLGMVAQAAESPYILPQTATLIPPVHGVIKSPFGGREHPVTGGSSNHTGIDIAGTRGTTIISAAPGRVCEIREGDAVYGNCITIEHTPALKTFYAHLDSIMVREGEIVDDNTKIGEMGDTGLTTGVHLHFGVLEQDNLVDPESYISLPHD